MEALEQGDWLRAAAMMHPDTLARFRSETQSRIAEWERHPPLRSAEEIMGDNPDMPREVAEYQAREWAEWVTEHGPELPRWLARVNDASEALRLSEVELFARYIEAKDPRYQVQSAYERAGREMPEPVRDGSAAGLVRTVIGAVMEDETTAHVVYRKSWFHGGTPAPDRRVDTLTLERTEGGWRARDFDFSGHGPGVWVSYGVPEEDPGTAADA